MLFLVASANLIAQNYISVRPAESARLFTSSTVEAKIQEVSAMLANPKLAWMFVNCYPNTLDTTVHFNEAGNDGRGDTFVYTGDIAAMWLRDSGAQVWPYVRYAFTVVLLHHAALFFLETFSFARIEFLLLRILCSTLLTVLLLVSVEFIRHKR